MRNKVPSCPNVSKFNYKRGNNNYVIESKIICNAVYTSFHAEATYNFFSLIN